GQVGISTVPPELVRDMLPPGLMQLASTLTLQAPGVAQFATPVQMTYPNVYGAAPGEKLDFYSFDHTTGRLVITGMGTVSADGLLVTTDPGPGITNPGWFGFPPPGGPSGPRPCMPSATPVNSPYEFNRFLTKKGQAARPTQDFLFTANADSGLLEFKS